MAGRIPCTIITGFLGAGKTTLIQSLVAAPAGRKLALIVNEFGTVGVDRDLVTSCGIAGCRDEDVIELANGCICCTVAEDFLPTLTRLLDRREPPDHIVIETSGLALPQPLLRAFAWPEVRARVSVDGVVAVIDAEAVSAGRFAHDEVAIAAQRAADETLDHESPLLELFCDQLQCADLIVLSKTDLIDEPALARVESIVRDGKRPAAKMLQSGRHKPPSHVLLGLGIGAENDIESRGHLHHGHHEDHIADDDDDHDHDHDHDAFESFVVDIDPVREPGEIAERVRRASQDPKILRVKGGVRVSGKPMRLVVQAVGPRVATHFDRPWRGDDADVGQLVVICLSGTDREQIAQTLRGPAH